VGFRQKDAPDMLKYSRVCKSALGKRYSLLVATAQRWFRRLDQLWYWLSCVQTAKNYSPLARVPTNLSSGSLLYGLYLLPLRQHVPIRGPLKRDLTFGHRHARAPEFYYQPVFSYKPRDWSIFKGCTCVSSGYSVRIWILHRYPIFTCVTGISSSYVG